MKAKNKYAEKFVGITSKEYSELEDRYRKVLTIFSKYKFERVLDIGCGDGNFSSLLKETCEAKEVHGIEVSEKGVKNAIKNGIKALQLDIDAEDFPFDDDYFDAVFAGEIIEHLFDSDHFLDEVHRCLKASGILVLTTPNLAAIHNRIVLLFGYQPFPMGVSTRMNIGRAYEPDSGLQSLDHIRVLTLHSLKELLKIHRFEILDVKGSCAMLPKDMRFSTMIRLFDKFLSLTPSLSYRVIISSKKKS